MDSPLQAVFDPHSIAVIGAAQDPTQVRGRLLHNLQVCGFRGEVYPVHPQHAQVQGLRAFPTVSAIGRPVDLALIAVPADSLMEVLRDCAQAEVRGAVVLSSIPVGEAGRKLQAQIKCLARRNSSGMRVLGPNCLGFLRPYGNLAATFSPLTADQFFSEAPQGRRVAIVSQSGGMGLQIHELCTQAGLHVVQLMMLGNEADLGVPELVEHAVASGEVDLVLLYLEGVHDGAAFMRAADRAAEAGIPIVAMKIGRTDAGTRAAVSHTAHLTGSDAVYEAVFHRYGITRVYDPETMVAVASVMVRRWRMHGARVAIVSTGGGHASLAADLCAMSGLAVAPLGQPLRERLATVIPVHGSTENPVDTAGALDDKGARFCHALHELVAADEVDAVVASCLFSLPGIAQAMEPHLAQLAAQLVKPVVFSSSATPTPEFAAIFRRLGIHPLPLAAAAQALQALESYSAFLRRRAEAPQSVASSAPAMAHAHNPFGSRQEQVAMLRAFGIPLPAEALAKTEDEAATHAETLGFPVALKIESPDIPHKTEAGGVRLRLMDAASVRGEFSGILRSARDHAPAARVDGVLVQAMAPPGLELIVGMVRDADFGPQLVVGFGGVFAEILRDVVVSPLPVGVSQAHGMLRRLRGIEILQGARGQPRADLDAVAQLLARVSSLVLTYPGIGQLDLNPVIVHAQGRGVHVVDSLLVPAAEAAENDGEHP